MTSRRAAVLKENSLVHYRIPSSLGSSWVKTFGRSGLYQHGAHWRSASMAQILTHQRAWRTAPHPFHRLYEKSRKEKRWSESVMNENFRFRLFSRARTPHRSPRPGTLPGVRLDRKKAARKARVEETPKWLTTKPEIPAAWQETEEELSSIAAISLFTVKKSTVLTSSIKNRFWRRKSRTRIVIVSNTEHKKLKTASIITKDPSVLVINGL